MALTILDPAVAAAVAAATSQEAQRAALLAPFGSAAVTVRAMNGATLRETMTFRSWVFNSATPRGATLGDFLARSVASTGAPTSFVFRAGSADVFSMTGAVSPGSADIVLAANIAVGPRTNLADAGVKVTISANPALPVTSAVATAFTLSLSASSGANGAPVTVTVTPNGPIPTGGVSVTLAASNGGTLGTTSLSFTSGSTAAQTTTLTRAAAGTSVVTMTNNVGLSNGASVSFTSAAPAVPVVPTSDLTQFLTSDGGSAASGTAGNFSGPSRDLWHRRLAVPWKRTNTLGNWLDAAQAEEGSTAYGSTAALTAAGQVASVAVTALVARWMASGLNRGFYLRNRSGTSAFPVEFHGRLDPTPTDRPTLTVITSVGAYTLTAAANACWNTSSFGGLPSGLAWRTVLGSQPAILRFDLSGVVGVVASATLTFKVKSFPSGGSTGQIVDVFEADPPTMVLPEGVVSPVTGLADGYADFAAMKASGNAALIFCDDFASPGPFDTAFSPAATRTLDSAAGTTYARGTIAAGANGSADQKLQSSQGTGTQGAPSVVYDELFSQYWLHLEDTFGTTQNDAIKIPAMGVQWGYWNPAGGGYWQQTTGNGGSVGTGLKVDRGGGLNFEYQGHSARFLTGNEPTTGDDDPYAGYFALSEYTYHLDQTGPNPAGSRFGNNVVIRKGQTYCIDIRVQQNTMTGAQDGLGNYATANLDGRMQAWINGYPALDITRRWRKHAEMGVEGLWVDVYHGGVTTAPRDMHYRLDRVTVATSYIGPSKRADWPAWRRAMAANTWAEIPTTNVLADLDPALTGLEPPGNDWVGTRGMTLGGYSWTGAVWDEATGTAWLTMLGGHADYGGNQPHKIKLDEDAPTFVRVRLPSGAVGMPAIVANDGTQPTCLYSDGRIRPGHTYNNHAFVPGVGPVITRISGAYRDGTNSTGGVSHPAVRVARRIDPAGEAHVLCDYSGISGQGGGGVTSDDGAAAFDPTRGAAGTLWVVGHSNNSRLIGIDVATGVATPLGATNYYIDSGGAMEYLPGIDALAFVTLGGVLRILRLDQGATSPVTPTLSGSYSAGLDWPVDNGAAVSWSSELGKLLIWINNTDRAEISTLTPSDPADVSAPWVRGVLAVSGSNAVTPPAIGNGGPFGRGRYSSRLGGFLLICNMTFRPHFFATE